MTKRAEKNDRSVLPDELLSICMHVATAKFSLNFSLVDPRPKIPFREWIVHQIMVLLKCSITFESIQLIFLQCFIAFTCYSIIVSFFRSRIKKWNNQRKRVESERKKIYTYSGIKKKGNILNERINRINSNKKEESITVDKYGESGDVTAIKIVKRNKWIRFTVAR